MAELKAELKAERRDGLRDELPRFVGSRLAVQQFGAIAWLRWRMVANSFRRKGGAGELIARILLYPLFAVLALLPTVVAGVLAWYYAGHGPFTSLVWVLWGAVVLTQLLNINLGQPGTMFDPNELIRFPMPLRRFVMVRLCFGLLAPANLIVTLVSLAVVVGVVAARPALWAATLVSMAVFAAVNILFTRMIFAWVDRWLSTRRAREIFTALIFISSIGIQYLNVRFNPGFQPHHSRVSQGEEPPGTEPLEALAKRVHPYVRWLPPELTADAIVGASTRNGGAWAVDTGGTLGFAAAFLCIYALRMRTEFRGENLSDAAVLPRRERVTPAPVTPLPATPLAAAAVEEHPHHGGTGPLGLPPSFLPLMSKELLVLRRNVGLFYGLVAPAVMVFLFAGRLSARSGSHWVLLGAVAYALLGIAPMSYNAFGYEGTGAQFYFFAPVRLRDIFLAKNLFGLLLAMAEIVLVVAITSYVAGRPRLSDCLFALFWAGGTVLLNTTLGNVRSVSAPKRVTPGRTMGKAQSAVSGYIAMGVLGACVALGYGCELLALYLDKPWVGIALMTTFAAVATFVYVQGLGSIEGYALDHRDTLFEELGKRT